MTTPETDDHNHRPRDLEAEGHSREAAEELVRQAKQVQELDVEGHGLTRTGLEGN